MSPSRSTARDDPHAVVPGAVAAAVVEQERLAVLVDDQRVAARDRRVVDLDVGAQAAPEPRDAGRERDDRRAGGEVAAGDERAGVDARRVVFGVRGMPQRLRADLRRDSRIWVPWLRR